MKSTFLAVVVICALAVAGIGGTLANFSDTEEVFDNTFQSGSLDLLVWDGTDWVQQAPYGSGASGVIDVKCAAPDEAYWSTVYVANFGDCVSGDLYLAFKDFRCYDVPPTHEESGVWVKDDRYTPVWKLKPEPEVVAEYGGYIEQWYQDGMGPAGDECSWTKILEVKVKFDGVVKQNWTLLDPLVQVPPIEYIKLGECESCGGQHEVEIGLRYADQEYVGWEAAKLNELFKDWPTNRYMLDGAKFDLMFGLVQNDS